MIDFEQLGTGRHKILVVDDDPDVHAVTEMTLKTLTFQGRGVEILKATSAEEAVRILRGTPNVAVVLLDVALEQERSGLEVCERIRHSLRNRFTRILLRTGRPGTAPERQVSREYEIDGYLPKGQMTAARLYSATRSSLKTYAELTRLEHHRRTFARIDDAMLSLRPYQSVESMVEQVVDTAAEVLGAPETMLHLRLLGTGPAETEYSLGRADDLTAEESELRMTRLRRRVAGFAVSAGTARPGKPEIFDNGLLARFELDHGLGSGWIFVRLGDRDRFARRCLDLLARHAANSFYGAAAQRQIDTGSGPRRIPASF